MNDFDTIEDRIIQSQQEEIEQLKERITELEKTSTVGVMEEQLRNADETLKSQGEQIDRYLARIKELKVKP